MDDGGAVDSVDWPADTSVGTQVDEVVIHRREPSIVLGPGFSGRATLRLAGGGETRGDETGRDPDPPA